MVRKEDELIHERLAELEAANKGMRRELENFQQSEERLRLGEERYRSLVEAITAIVWNTPASGEFEVEQPRWSEFTGPDFRAAQGMGLAERGPPGRPAEYRPRVVGGGRQPVALPR